MSDKLKTLKDIRKYLPEDPYCVMDYFTESKDKRTTNSKHYKNAKKKYEECGLIYTNDLKKEVMKWIKELDRDCKKYRKDPLYYAEINKYRDRYGYSPTLTYFDELQIQIRWIKHFFNITEDELNDAFCEVEDE